jgi:hypothetical protein
MIELTLRRRLARFGLLGRLSENHDPHRASPCDSSGVFERQSARCRIDDWDADFSANALATL